MEICKKSSVTNFGNEDNMTFSYFVYLFIKYLNALKELELFHFTIKNRGGKITDFDLNLDLFHLKREKRIHTSGSFRSVCNGITNMSGQRFKSPNSF